MENMLKFPRRLGRAVAWKIMEPPDMVPDPTRFAWYSPITADPPVTEMVVLPSVSDPEVSERV